MEVVKINELSFNGIKTRTNNQLEMNPETASIGDLWQQFYSIHTENESVPEKSYGIYCNYENDYNGDYDLVVASEKNIVTSESINVTIPSGKYLRFEKSGKLPEAAMELWREVWTFFKESSEYERNYDYDFEEYLSMNDVAIYIGIK